MYCRGNGGRLIAKTSSWKRLHGAQPHGRKSAKDLSGLQQRAIALESHAEAKTQAYQRATWIRFVGVFFPIPFIVVLLRLEMAAWTYYVWGALILSAARCCT